MDKKFKHSIQEIRSMMKDLRKGQYTSSQLEDVANALQDFIDIRQYNHKKTLPVIEKTVVTDK